MSTLTVKSTMKILSIFVAFLENMNFKESSVYNNMNHLVCIMNTLEHGRHLCCQNLTLKVSGFVVAKFQMFLNFANQRLSIFVSNTVAYSLREIGEWVADTKQYANRFANTSHSSMVQKTGIISKTINNDKSG